MESHEKELLNCIDGNSSKLQKKANNSLYDLFKGHYELALTSFSYKRFLMESHKKELLLCLDVKNFHGICAYEPHSYFGQKQPFSTEFCAMPRTFLRGDPRVETFYMVI